MRFRALVTNKDATGTVASSVETLGEEDLPAGNVTVDIEWAGFNYKDGLCLTGGGGLVRQYPHIGGVDFAGTVWTSDDSRYTPGQPAVLTGWRVGETHWGGFAERARVNADWLVPLPEGLSTRDAMIVGTAGLAAMLSIDRLEAAGVEPGGGDILVTGAAGGVGSIATAMLYKLGYAVTALSGRPEHLEAMKALGATAVLSRDEFLAAPDKVLESSHWAGAVDSVGGAVLSKLLRQVKYGGAVAAVGNAGGISLETNVLPFILRGVSLIGIDTVMQPYTARVAAWKRIAMLFDPHAYSPLVQEIGLEEVPKAAAAILAGRVHGRLLVKP
jgi:acrylyl-CoA reductase (NADPH)